MSVQTKKLKDFTIRDLEQKSYSVLEFIRNANNRYLTSPDDHKLIDRQIHLARAKLNHYNQLLRNKLKEYH